MPDYDAILIPGGGVREGGELPSWVRRRLDRARELHAGAFFITLSAGTTHRPPPLDRDGFPIFESVAAAKYLVSAGIPQERVLIEAHSYDTIGNAFFSRILHVDPRALRKLLVITSDFHLPRTRAVFEWIYGLTPQAVPYELSFEAVSDPDMDRALALAREEKERKSLAALAGLIPRLKTLRDFHQWLFTEHDAYRATDAVLAEQELSGDALESY